jgi:hypothetical protein
VKPENQFITGIHKYLPPTIYRMKNNNAYTAGIPDVWYSGTKADLWVEYKFVPRVPQRDVVLPDLSLLQKYWLRERHHEGRNVAVIVGCPAGGVILEDMTWEREVEGFSRLILPRPDLARWLRGYTEG